MTDESIFPEISPQASETRTMALADVFRMSFLDRTVPPPAATGSSASGSEEGEHPRREKDVRLARSVDLLERVTE
eukprot:8240307-Alexandrium_andersonii.AAC.1